MSEPTSDFREEYVIPKDLMLEDIEKGVRAALKASVKTHPDIWKEAESSGLTADTRLFDLKAEQGVDAATAALLVTLAVSGAKLGVKIASDVWSKIVLPWLIEKYGRQRFKKK